MQKHVFRTKRRTPGDAPLIDRPLIELAAAMGELPRDKEPALIAKMTALATWYAAVPDDIPAADLHAEMQACADALFEAEMRVAALGFHARQLLRETYHDTMPSAGAAKSRYAKAILFGNRSAAGMSGAGAMVSADLRAVSRLTRVADIAACASKPKGGAPRLLDGIADEVLAAWCALIGRRARFGRRKDKFHYPMPDFCACRSLLQVLLPTTPIVTLTSALWLAFDRTRKAGTETPAETAEGFPPPRLFPSTPE